MSASNRCLLVALWHRVCDDRCGWPSGNYRLCSNHSSIVALLVNAHHWGKLLWVEQRAQALSSGGPGSLVQTHQFSRLPNLGAYFAHLENENNDPVFGAQ